MKKYAVTVEHDKGKARLIVLARSIAEAREIVKQVEGCPDRAILSVIPQKKARK